MRTHLLGNEVENGEEEAENQMEVNQMQMTEQAKSRGQRILEHPLFQAGFFVLFSFLEFVFLELFFDKAFYEFSPLIICKNVALILACNLFLVGIFHCLRPALCVSAVVFLLVGIANYFVILFRGYGIVFMDFYALKTAATVAGKYQYRINMPFVLAVFGFLGLFLAGRYLLPGRRHPYKSVRYTLISLLGMAVSVAFFAWINLDVVFFRDVSSLTWDHNVGMKEYGYLLYFSSNAGKATVSEPTGYSVEKVEEALEPYQKEVEEEKNVQHKEAQKPNLIMIMNESFADLRVLGKLSTNREIMPFYDSLEENTIKGFAYSSVYGGYTSNSEFEFLTGCTKEYLPGNPYLQYLDDSIPSLIQNLKNQGYEETIAMHPYYSSGYNRNRVYPLLGFDKCLWLEDFSGGEKVRDYIGDWEDYQKIIELYEKKKKGTSLCVFNVTMQNHNPYDDKNYVFEEPVEVENFPATLSTEQYLSLIHMSDKALEMLVSYFQKAEEPTVIVMFGDHQPHLSDSFYEHMLGVKPDFFSQEQVMKEHMVPFMIWANYDIPEQKVEMTSLNYLSKLMLETAGLKTSAFDRYLSDLQKKLPSISASGYYDEKGVLYDFSQENDTCRNLLHTYEMIQYHYLFSGRERLDDYFEVSTDESASRTASAN